MDWSKTKTIFIVVFLILDVFLLYQLVEKRTSNQLGLLAETTLEEQLEDNEITIEVNLPKGPMNETYISGSSRKFTNEEISQLKGQTAQIVGNTKIYSKFTTPIPLKEPNTLKSDTKKWLTDLIKLNVLEGNSYVYWGFNEVKNEFLFYQVYDGKTIYDNVNAQLKLIMNDKNEIVGYEQTYLEAVEEMDVDGEKAESFTALKAIENMYDRNELQPGSVVTSVELGYYTLVEDSQVFVPTWHFIIDNKDSYFVNALEGHIIRDGAMER